MLTSFGSYGGYFSDNPTVEPDAQRLCRYNIPSKEWSPVSTSGDTVTRVAEGASAVTPPTNSGESDPLFYYSFGHLDAYTTQGWSVQTERVYLNSMIEFDQSSNSWNNRTTVSGSNSEPVLELTPRIVFAIWISISKLYS